MQRLNAYITLLVSLIIFAPLLLVRRDILDQGISGVDLLLAAPIALHFGLMIAMVSIAKYDSGRFTIEELKAYRVLIIGSFVLAMPLWIIVVAAGNLPTSVVLSSSVGLLFALYDLLTLIGRLQTVRQLRRIVLIGVLLPAAIAFGLSALSILHAHWQYFLNPVAIFFICRTALTSKPRAASIKT